jgi:hypothetical protein
MEDRSRENVRGGMIHDAPCRQTHLFTGDAKNVALHRTMSTTRVALSIIAIFLKCMDILEESFRLVYSTPTSDVHDALLEKAIFYT